MSLLRRIFGYFIKRNKSLNKLANLLNIVCFFFSFSDSVQNFTYNIKIECQVALSIHPSVDLDDQKLSKSDKHHTCSSYFFKCHQTFYKCLRYENCVTSLVRMLRPPHAAVYVYIWARQCIAVAAFSAKGAENALNIIKREKRRRRDGLAQDVSRRHHTLRSCRCVKARQSSNFPKIQFHEQ